MKFNVLTFNVLTLLFLGSAAHAAIEVPLNDKHVIEVSISREDLTRIAVQDDRIRNVFGVAGEYVLEADEEQGQVFIRPRNPEIPVFTGTGVKPGFKPISLTVTTEGGHTQDLRLIPKDQPPEAIILKSDHEIKEELKHERQSSLTHDDITRDVIETLLNACRSGRIPLGYKQMPLDLNTLKGPYPLTREIRGEKLRCLTYEVKNSTSASLTLSEPEFASGLPPDLIRSSSDIVAVFMPQKILTPGERTSVYVVARTH